MLPNIKEEQRSNLYPNGSLKWRTSNLPQLAQSSKSVQNLISDVRTVTSTFSRIYGRILAKLVQLEYKNMEMEEQSGFRAGRSCIDNIFCITQIKEKR